MAISFLKAKRLFCFVALFLVFNTHSLAQNPKRFSQSFDKTAAKIERYMQSAVATEHFSGSILIARNGRAIISKGYGSANYELNVPNTPQTVFRIGSNTKQFTAMSIMMLHERGRLNVGDSVCKYVRDCPPAWQEITVRHLLSHTSGIPNYTSLPDFGKIMLTTVPPPALVEIFKNKPLDFKPGERWSYNNSGYYLLGLIIERISGKSYSEFLKENIFRPLGLKKTGYDNSGEIIKNRAAGYALQDKTLVNALPIDMSIPYSAGGLYSTTGDLLIWEQAHYTDKLISGKSMDEMFTPVKNDYGYGWESKKMFNRQIIRHGGNINGFATYLARVPTDRLTIIVLCNREKIPAKTITENLLAIIYNQSIQPPKQ